MPFGRIGNDFRYRAPANLSTRFPYFSAGMNIFANPPKSTSIKKGLQIMQPLFYGVMPKP